MNPTLASLLAQLGYDAVKDLLCNDEAPDDEVSELTQVIDLLENVVKQLDTLIGLQRKQIAMARLKN